jgi:hypothetical protein
MNMKKYTKAAAVALAMVLAGSAHAANSFAYTVDAGKSFADYFEVTVGKTNGLFFSVAGSSSDFSNLKFDFLTVSGLNGDVAAPGTPATGYSATFNDARNVGFNLLKDSKYLVKVSGFALANATGKDAFTLTTINGTSTITAVPEPESYAMLLAGLGLMGAIARRRKAKQA